MRTISGAILVLSATVLYSVRWLGSVLHDSTVSGSPEARSMTLASAVLCLAGLAVAAFGLFRDGARGE